MSERIKAALVFGLLVAVGGYMAWVTWNMPTCEAGEVLVGSVGRFACVVGRY